MNSILQVRLVVRAEPGVTTSLLGPCVLWQHKTHVNSCRQKSRGRPATGKGTPIGVRLQPEMLAALDQLIAKQADPKPSRPEAIRRLVEAGLKGPGEGPTSATPADAGEESASIGQRLLDAAKHATAIVKAKLPGSES